MFEEFMNYQCLIFLKAVTPCTFLSETRNLDVQLSFPYLKHHWWAQNVTRKLLL